MEEDSQAVGRGRAWSLLPVTPCSTSRTTTSCPTGMSEELISDAEADVREDQILISCDLDNKVGRRPPLPSSSQAADGNLGRRDQVISGARRLASQQGGGRCDE